MVFLRLRKECLLDRGMIKNIKKNIIISKRFIKVVNLLLMEDLFQIVNWKEQDSAHWNMKFKKEEWVEYIGVNRMD